METSKKIRGLKITKPGATYVQTPAFNLADFTIAFEIIYWYGNSAQGSTTAMVWGHAVPPGRTGYFIAHNNLGRGIIFATRSSDTAEYFDIGYDSGVPQVGKRHIIAVGRMGRTWRLWFDGRKVSEASDTRSGVEFYFYHRIGVDYQWQYPVANRVPGDRYVNPRVVFWAAFWTRLLDDSEVRALTNNPFDPPRDGLLAWYIMSNVSGTTVYDLSGNRNHATLVGTGYEWEYY